MMVVSRPRLNGNPSEVLVMLRNGKKCRRLVSRIGLSMTVRQNADDD